MENTQTIKTSYSKKELWLDSTAFLASSALTCAARSIAPLDPAAIGLLLSAAANTGAVQAASAFGQKYSIDSRLLQLCALISALAISTLALPWILSAASFHSLALLSFETAIESTLLHVALKAASYGAFYTGLYIKDAFTVSLPTSLQNVQKMSESELLKVRDHLVNFPSKGQYLPLPIHQQLRARLKEADLESPPLTHFSHLGDDWSDRDLTTLHKQDLRGLPLYKRAQLNELFFARDFPPQERPYELGELPELDAPTVLKLTTSSKINWAHLILRLNRNAEIPAGIPKLFHKYGLPPARSEWIPMTPPPSAKAISSLEEREISWYQNFYAKNPRDWEALPAEIRTELKGRFKTPSLFSSPPRTPITGRVSKDFPWNTIVAGIALGVLGVAAYYTLSSYSNTSLQELPIPGAVPKLFKPSTALVPAGPLLDKFPVRIDFSLLRKPLEKVLQPSTALVPAGPLLDKSPVRIDFSLLRKPLEKVLQPSTALVPAGPLLGHPLPRLNLSGIQIIDKVFQFAAPITLPISQNTSMPEIFHPSNATKITDIASKAIPELDFTQTTPLSSVISFWRYPLSVALITSVGICSLTYALSQKKQAVEFRPEHGEEVPEIGAVAIPNSEVGERREVAILFGGQRITLDLDNPLLRANLSNYLAQLGEMVRSSRAPWIAIFGHNIVQTLSADQFLQTLGKMQAIAASQSNAPLRIALPQREAAPEEVAMVPQVRKANWIELCVGERSYRVDLLDPYVQQNLPEFLGRLKPMIQQSPEDLISIKFDDDRIWSMPRTKVLEGLDKISGLEAARERQALLEAVPPQTLTKKKFMTYCGQKKVDYDHQTAWDDAKEGVRLFQLIRAGSLIDPTKENLRKICWGMMAHKIEQGIGFENGTFVVKDPGYRLFKTFCACSEIYGRASSHFKKRAIPTSEGSWKGYSHFGADIDNLPPNMRTILMGMIEMKGGEETTYIKLEDWGADMRLKSLDKAQHFFFHSFGFLTSQYRRFMETNQTDDDRKEHLDPADKKIIGNFIKAVEPLLPEEKKPDLNEWGFIEAVPYLVKALEQPGISLDIAGDIRSYLGELDERYGEKLYTQKGHEAQLLDSIIEYDTDFLNRSLISPPSSAPVSNPDQLDCGIEFHLL